MHVEQVTAGAVFIISQLAFRWVMSSTPPSTSVVQLVSYEAAPIVTKYCRRGGLMTEVSLRSHYRGQNYSSSDGLRDAEFIVEGIAPAAIHENCAGKTVSVCECYLMNTSFLHFRPGKYAKCTSVACRRGGENTTRSGEVCCMRLETHFENHC